MNGKTSMALIAAIVASASAQSIQLSGTVKSQTGKALSGAIVKLAGVNLTDTTDNQGAFSINKTITASMTVAGSPVADKISMQGGAVALSLAKPAQVTVEMFDLRGNMLARLVERPSTAGDYRVNVMAHPLAASVKIVRVSIGQYSATFRSLPLNHGSGAVSIAATVASAAGAGLAKTAATVDTLKVTASGFVAGSMPISSYQTTITVTLDTVSGEKFSFFVTSMAGLQTLSGNTKGFGGNFSFGKTGQGAGLLGADSICQCLAEASMPGAKSKQWRAFLSVTKDASGKQVNAIDRIGTGPWYDRLGRVVSPNIAGLLATRPNADAAIKNDLPNEYGIPNHRPDPNAAAVDNHHMLTGSNTSGKLNSTSSASTCEDWTSVTASGKPRCGFSWPRNNSDAHWISGWDAGGCAAGYDLSESSMAGSAGDVSVGKGGGYGGFYCFALNP
jgi:hypothetical protein